MWKKPLLIVAGTVAAIQLVPYGRAHENPARTQEPAWDHPRTRELAKRACFDCHSRETVWPWYTHVAPFSWLVTHHVDEGREHLDFSNWVKPGERQLRHAEEAADALLEGEMPLGSYLLAHPEARLTDDEKRDLAEGFTRTFGGAENDD